MHDPENGNRTQLIADKKAVNGCGMIGSISAAR
jgi:hypothetical protein